MILPDVNVLVSAYRREADDRDRYRTWLTAVLAGKDELALHDLPLVGFARIVTNPRIMARPAPLSSALAFVDRLRSARRARWLPAGDVPWDALRGLATQDKTLGGNLLPDAHLAVLAIAHGARLATADRGLPAFPSSTGSIPQREDLRFVTSSRMFGVGGLKRLWAARVS